jgi:integrase/recombinase XerC
VTPDQKAQDWELLNQWCRSMKSRNFSKATLKNYRQTTTRFLIWTADRDLTVATMTHGDIVGWLDSCKLGPRARYANTSVLAMFYRWLVREELIDHDPTLKVDRPRLGRYLPRPAAGEQIRYAMAHAEPRVAAMIALGAFAGMRRSEITNLRVEDLLLSREPPVILVHGKGGRERLMPLHDAIWLALCRYGLPKAGWIFPSPTTGRALSAQYVGKLVTDELSTIDVHTSTHQLRHFFGTEVYRLSKDLRLTQELMGHANPANTAIYTAWSRDDAQAVVERLTI